jgi:hypothetical protein
MTMLCLDCRTAASRFDVHCRTCGARLEVPDVEQQLVDLEMDVEQAVRESAAQDAAIAREADRARTRAHQQEIGRAVMGATTATIAEFFRAVFRPWDRL